MPLYKVKTIDNKYKIQEEAQRYINFLKQLEDNDLEVWNKIQIQLRDSGKTEVADKISVEMRKTQIKVNYDPQHSIFFFWYHFTGWLTHYGTNFYRPIIYFLFPLFIVSSIIFSNPKNISPTFDAMEAHGGYADFFTDKNEAEYAHNIRLLPQGTQLTYESVCMYSEKERWKNINLKKHFPLPHPICEGVWTLVDGIEMALTYHLPMLSYFVEPAWEARSEPIETDQCLLKIPTLDFENLDSNHLPTFQGDCYKNTFTFLTPGHYTFFASFISWIIIPIYFYGFASRIIRRYER